MFSYSHNLSWHNANTASLLELHIFFMEIAVHPNSGFPIILGFVDHSILQCMDDFSRNFFATGKINHLYRITVHSISKQQYFKILSLGISVNTVFLQIDQGERFDIYTQNLHSIFLPTHQY